MNSVFGFVNSTMNIKVETQTSRVKGIGFHSSRPWVIFSTHTGSVHIYDYNINVEIAQYSVSEKPVRCVAFHPTQPLFACGTDEFKVVVYNWQKKIKLFSLEGHLDYIRSIEFHSVYPLLMTSSDDSTSRIWNWQSRCCVSVLEDHTYFVMSSKFNPQLPYVATACFDECVRIFNIQPLLQSSMSKDVDSTFFSLEQTSNLVSESEEHQDGANSVSWDNSGSMLVSGGEDSVIKCFKFSNEELTLQTSISAHTAAVTAVIFHLQSGNIISASEDFSVRIFDGNTYKELAKHDIPGSRFWCLASHPRDALFAAGHDQGFIVFKMNKERTPFDVQGTSVASIQNKEIHIADVISKKSENAVSVKSGAKSISWNPSRSIAIVSYYSSDNEPYYEAIDVTMKNPIIKGLGFSTVWLSRSSIASLSVAKDKLLIGELGSSVPKGVQIPRAVDLFSAGAQKLFITTKSSIILFDAARQTIINEISFPECKFICLNDDKTEICATSSHSIMKSSADLNNPSIFNESGKIKSACFCGEAILYTTRTHLKYIVANDDGVVCSLPRILYIIKAQKDTAWFVSRDGAVFKRGIELGEVYLKLALKSGDIEGTAHAKRIVVESPPIGFAVMEFAARNERYDIAASLAKDSRTKFEMCLHSGDFEGALHAADELKDQSIYKILGEKAIISGKFQLAENSYKKASDFESLAMLYIITSQESKLQNISKQSLSPLHLIWTNDDESLKKILFNLSPELEKSIQCEDESPKVIFGNCISADWPTIQTSFPSTKNVSYDNDGVEDSWPQSSSEEINNEEEDGWDLGLPFDGTVSESVDSLVIPNQGESYFTKLAKNSSTAGDLASAGQFGDALIFLSSTIAARNLCALKDLFIESFIGSNSYILHQYGISICPISSSFRNQPIPATPDPFIVIDEMMKAALSAFSKGKFSDCLSLCIGLIRKSTMASVNTKEEMQKILDSINTAMNYSLGVQMEIMRKTENDPGRLIELAVYFTHVKMIASHERLTLQSAMRVAMKYKNHITAKPIIQRLLDLSPAEKIATPARQALQTVNSNLKNEIEIEYNERNPFIVCAVSKKPIYRGKSSVMCPLCGCCAMQQFAGKLCPICEISELGAKVEGLKILRTTK